ncbi:hypothetical protein FTV88_1588 [Heliorestis convoluta]|uniref:Uncharacterized protein n=1 Tax=Heliorestis convoluta TaxID=356322 RepID=A0A5Q2MY92_9FIRM|nr:hypothetical protein FTV88_1588 [Heliorestis convoluta]
MGVWWTIQKQKIEKFIDIYPKKIKSVNNLTDGLSEVINKGYNDVFSVPYNMENFIREEKSNLRKLRDEACELEVNIYKALEKLGEKLQKWHDDYNTKINYVEENEYGNMVLTEESKTVRKQFIEEYKNDVERILYEVHSFKRKLQFIYLKYSKDNTGI